MDFKKWKEDNEDIIEGELSRDTLIMYCWNELNLTEFVKNEPSRTVEQVIKENYEALENEELKDMKDDILDTLSKLERYKDKGLYIMTTMDIFGLEYIVHTEKYEFVEHIIL